MPTETQPTFLEKTGLPERDIPRFLALIEELIGIPYEFSPESTSRQLLLSLHNRPGGKRLEVAEMPPPALIPNLETDLMWIRPLTKEEEAAPYIVAYDVNAAYLAACSSLVLGVGTPRHWTSDETGGHDTHADVGCGYYYTGAWVSSPTQHWQLEEMRGVPIWVSEAYEWAETSRPLEPWYKVLRDARERAMLEQWRDLGHGLHVGDAVLACIKQMYTGFIGRLCATGWDRTGDVLYRPDWRHMIIATRRTRLQRVMAQTDPAPFAAYSDCLYFAVPSSPPVQGLKLGTNPGAFKLHGIAEFQYVDDGLHDLAPVLKLRAAVESGDLYQLVRLVK